MENASVLDFSADCRIDGMATLNRTYTDAFIVGDQSQMHLAVGGAQVQMPNVYLPSIADFDFTDPLNGYLVADKFNIRQTHDGGTTWNIATLVPSETLDSYPTLVTLKGSNSELAYVAGNGRKFVEVNGLQATFPTLTLPVAISSTADITDLGISAIDHTLKYMLVRDGTTTGAEGYFLQKGTSWATKKKWNTKNPRGLWVFRNDNVIIAGTKSLVWYYDGSTVTDYGDVLPSGLTLNAVTFFDDINGYVAGEEGKLYKSSGWTFDTYPFVVSPTNIWEPKNTLDNLGGQTVQANIIIKALATPGRFSLMSGGSYSPPGTAHIGYSRITHDESITFSTRFWYDRIGRLILSQNTKQFNQTPQQYSYTLYDALGRITEAGVKEENTGTGSPPLFKSIFGAWVSNYYNPNVIDNTKLEAWITEEDDARSEVTRTFYDAPLSGLSIADFTQENLRKRIASVSYAESYDSDPLTYDYASHYSYDIHGNVKSMVQDNQLLSTIVTDQRYKRLDYNYDLISGKVNEVRYQKGKADEWNHRYTYDADNRIKNVKTSTNYIIWDEDAKYFYYEHGPLARTELGQNKVQGIDYVYTLQGWLKGINSTTLDSNRDVGQDGYSSSANEQFAPDAYSYSLGYYTEDYKPIDATNKWTTVASRFISNPAGSFMLTHRDDLHNGNISYMMTTITDPSDGSRLPQATAYRYDQLNRLLEERAFNNINETTNLWNSGGSYNNRYFNDFTYDGNGNIVTQRRHNKAGTQVDSLNYNYNNKDGEVMQNRLYHVNDGVDDGEFGDDIDDQYDFDNDPDDVNTNNNYSYTELGELKKDEQEEIESIVWRTDGKIKEIIRESTSSKKNLKFEYDPMGNRIAKHVLTSANVEESVTYYVRDAQGNIMSTYVKTAPGSILSYKVEERHLYGSSRLGIYGEQSEMIGATVSTTYFNHLLGKRSFEGVNHLGNVLTVFSDRKFPQNSGGDVSGFKAELFTSQDYYPFGMVMPGRDFSANDYRYGFNGKESINEVKGTGNWQDYGMRMYDNRICRFPSVDPIAKQFPYYSPYQYAGNKPIVAIDLDGMEDLWVNTIIYTNPESGTNSYVYSVMDLNTSLKNQLSTIFGDPFLQSFRDKFGDDGSIVTVSDQFGNYSFVQGLINLEFTPPKEDLQFQVSYATANVGFASGISVDKGTISISPNSPSLDAGVVYHFSGTNIEATTPSIGIAWNEGMGKIRTNKLFPMAGELIANTETQSKSFTIGFFGFTVENSTGKNGEEISINYASPGGGRGIAFKRFGFGFSISNNVASEMESYTPTQEDSIRVAKDGAAKGIKDYKDYLKKKNL